MKQLLIILTTLSYHSAFAGNTITIDSLYLGNKNLLIKNEALFNIDRVNGVQQIKDQLGNVTCEQPHTFPARKNLALQPIYQNGGRIYIFFGKNPSLEKMMIAGLGAETLTKADFKLCDTFDSSTLINAWNSIRFFTIPSPYTTFGEDLKKMNPDESYLCGYKVSELIAGDLTPFKCIKDNELPTDFDFTGLSYSTETLGILF